MKKASELIQQLFSDLDVESKEHVVSLFRSWEQIAGTDIAAHTSIREIEGSQVIIESDHPGWAHMVLMNKKRIIARIRHEYPELDIKTLRVVTR